MKLSLKQTRLGLRNSTTRLPFRYGRACLTRCPQAVFAVTIEVDGHTQRHTQDGYSGDCLPPGWFDKAPDKDYATQIDDMLAVIALAEKTFVEEFAQPTEFFPAWMVAVERIQQRAAEWGLTALLASFGSSLLERALMDAMCRAARVSFSGAVRRNLFRIEPGDVHAQLAGRQVYEWLPHQPLPIVAVRHTVGLADPLTASEIPPEYKLKDGFPQSLEEYLVEAQLAYLKIKVSGDLQQDVDRLGTISALMKRHRGRNYAVTLDGNEQFTAADQFEQFVRALIVNPRLSDLLTNTLAIEQPMERSIALSESHAHAVQAISQFKPVIIDESDGSLDAYARAIELGYRGVSSKNCKGAVKSLLNAGLTWIHNDFGSRDDYIMTGEDLCSVGIIPVQSDLCLAATLGLKHVERNGHHYHPGLSYLTEREQEAALRAHADFYEFRHDRVTPHITDGKMEIGSLQCVGFGFDVEPDFDAMQSATEWEFASLGLGSDGSADGSD